MQQFFVIAFEYLGGFCAIEAYGMKDRVLMEKGGKVIRGRIPDGCIQAAIPLAGINGIPEGNMMPQQHGKPFLIFFRRGIPVL